jgi:hypothetical protein
MFIVIVLGIVAALAIAAILIEPRDGPVRPYDPRGDLPLWAFRARC